MAPFNGILLSPETPVRPDERFRILVPAEITQGTWQLVVNRGPVLDEHGHSGLGSSDVGFDSGEVGPVDSEPWLQMGENVVEIRYYYESSFGSIERFYTVGTFDIRAPDSDPDAEVISLTANKSEVVPDELFKVTVIHRGNLGVFTKADLVINRIDPDGSQDTIYNQVVYSDPGTNEEEIVLSLDDLGNARLCAVLQNIEVPPQPP